MSTEHSPIVPGSNLDMAFTGLQDAAQAVHDARSGLRTAEHLFEAARETASAEMTSQFVDKSFVVSGSLEEATWYDLNDGYIVERDHRYLQDAPVIVTGAGIFPSHYSRDDRAPRLRLRLEDGQPVLMRLDHLHKMVELEGSETAS